MHHLIPVASTPRTTCLNSIRINFPLKTAIVGTIRRALFLLAFCGQSKKSKKKNVPIIIFQFTGAQALIESYSHPGACRHATEKYMDNKKRIIVLGRINDNFLTQME